MKRRSTLARYVLALNRSLTKAEALGGTLLVPESDYRRIRRGLRDDLQRRQVAGRKERRAPGRLDMRLRGLPVRKVEASDGIASAIDAGRAYVMTPLEQKILPERVLNRLPSGALQRYIERMVNPTLTLRELVLP